METDIDELSKEYSDYYDNFDLYMKKYVVPQVYARQFASYYYRGLIREETLRQYAGSIGDVFNVGFDFKDIRSDVEEILKIKYNLIITNDEPLIIKKYQEYK